MQEMSENLAVVTRRISTACVRAGRTLDSVRLVWVSKTRSRSEVEEAHALGARDFGENKVQEVVAKFNPPPADARVHVIGPIQSNKWRKAAQLSHWIHSADSLEQLTKFQEVCAELDKRLVVLVQVNAGDEISKHGLARSQAKEFLQKLHGRAGEFPHLQFRGLMTIGVNTAMPEDSRPVFAWLRALQQEAHSWGGAFAQLDQLSMGMTDDLEVAIEEGATLVRVGTALFGARNYGVDA